MGRRGKIIFSIIQLWLIVIGLLAIINQFSWWWKSNNLIEALTYPLVFIVLFSLRPIQNYFTNIPKPHQYILMTFFIIMFIGQIVNQPRLTFPFTSWAMYGQPEHPETLVFYQYEGLTKEQKRTIISPEELLPIIGDSAVASKFRFLVRAAFSGRDDAEREETLEELRKFLTSIGGIYNRHHPENTIHSLEIIQCSIDLRERGHSDVLRKSLLSVELKYRN